MEDKLKKLNIKRDSKYGVGKKMGYQLWVHKDYITDIMPAEEYEKFKSYVSKEFNFEVLRWDEKKGELAFIECNDFNTSHEPVLGKIQRILKYEGDEILDCLTIQNPPKDPLIYHHKWVFVKDDYKGFDVEESKKRSIEWKEKLGVDRTTSSKIGRLSFWNNWLLENNLPPRNINDDISSILKNLKEKQQQTNNREQKNEFRKRYK
jgi:hypothetical protein